MEDATTAPAAVIQDGSELIAPSKHAPTTALDMEIVSEASACAAKLGLGKTAPSHAARTTAIIVGFARIPRAIAQRDSVVRHASSSCVRLTAATVVFAIPRLVYAIAVKGLRVQAAPLRRARTTAATEALATLARPSANASQNTQALIAHTWHVPRDATAEVNA